MNLETHIGDGFTVAVLCTATKRAEDAPV